MAVASLVLGVLSLPTLGLLGVGALVGLVLGVVALVRASNAPEEHGGKGLAVAGVACSLISLLLVPVIGIVAAIAIPSLLRARVSANEAATIGDLRTVISAEAAYQSANAGYYDNLECLAAPSRCIPGYPAAGPVFLDGQLAAATTKSGYTRTFHPGPAASGADPAISSPSSLTSFAYVAVPATPGQTGVRGFCGDASGRICFTPDGSAPPVVDGACSPDCPQM